jgi:(E)-4-hydroxy-3-methylbut-2-enyl-diphosphate synthase
MQRKITRQLQLGSLKVGGMASITIQSMTNTKTTDVTATLGQIQALKQAGCDIVRLAVPDLAAAQALGEIKCGAGTIPLVADIHFDYRLALEAIHQGIDALRLNPGNMGSHDHVATVVQAAKAKGIPIRIGVNAGSLDPTILEKYGGHATAQGLVESALGHIAILEELGFFDIKVSLKANDVPMTILAYQLMSEAKDYPLHLGITEAGTVKSGIIKSAVGIGALLAQGIGDTLRVSLTGDPVEEVKVAKEILKSLGLMQGGPTLISCPTCGRCEIDLISIANAVEEKLASVKQPIKVAIMGCVVNGPGEAKEADIGIAGGKGQGLLFKKGQVYRKVAEADLITALMLEIDKLVEEK